MATNSSLLRQLIAAQPRKAAYSKTTKTTVLTVGSTVILAPDRRIVGVTVTNLDAANPIYINAGRDTLATLDGHYVGPQQTAFLSELLGDATTLGVSGIAATANVSVQVTAAFTQEIAEGSMVQ
jgi:hypothetical protein